MEHPSVIEEVVWVVMHENEFQARDLYDSVRGLQLQAHILLRQNQTEELGKVKVENATRHSHSLRG